jgi:hypothetical protein
LKIFQEAICHQRKNVIHKEQALLDGFISCKGMTMGFGMGTLQLRYSIPGKKISVAIRKPYFTKLPKLTTLPNPIAFDKLSKNLLYNFKIWSNK